ncbi:hypothetical protein Dda_0063 [Drechslerella dactyloides]|uniref:Uncharacterized protein n=1 Tax=Drechslerella dactyloides TaxID=74499 RepID=A0AAD6J7J6_DREDA|nr:hypothetical protein Dda_0063 [Drechslerella dactyloides]
MGNPFDKMGTETEAQDKPPVYQEFTPAVNPPTAASTSAPAQQPTTIEGMIESTGFGDTARRIEGASDYFRHSLLGFVDRVTGFGDAANEKDRLAAVAYDQMSTGKRAEPVTASQPLPPAEHIPAPSQAATTTDVPGPEAPLYPGDKK